MMANPVRDSARIGLATPWRRGGAAFCRAKTPATRLASLCPPVCDPPASRPEMRRSKKKTCRCEGLWSYARCGSGLFTTPPSAPGAAGQPHGETAMECRARVAPPSPHRRAPSPLRGLFIPRPMATTACRNPISLPMREGVAGCRDRTRAHRPAAPAIGPLAPPALPRAACKGTSWPAQRPARA
jgi:hypothetical protein